MEITRAYKTDFYIQKLQVEDMVVSRIEVYQELCRGKKVLHVGCTDYPVFNPENNLHIQLRGIAQQMDGFDIDAEGIKVLQQYAPGRYFTRSDEIKEHYDVVLVPEVIEHVPNIAAFLQGLSLLDFESIVIAAPCVVGYGNAFTYRGTNGRLQSELQEPNDYFEDVHPDHKVWFSPYTLANCIQMFTSWKLSKVLFLDQKCSVAAVAVK